MMLNKLLIACTRAASILGDVPSFQASPIHRHLDAPAMIPVILSDDDANGERTAMAQVGSRMATLSRMEALLKSRNCILR